MKPTNDPPRHENRHQRRQKQQAQRSEDRRRLREVNRMLKEHGFKTIDSEKAT